MALLVLRFRRRLSWRRVPRVGRPLRRVIPAVKQQATTPPREGAAASETWFPEQRALLWEGVNPRTPGGVPTTLGGVPRTLGGGPKTLACPVKEGRLNPRHSRGSLTEELRAQPLGGVQLPEAVALVVLRGTAGEEAGQVAAGILRNASARCLGACVTYPLRGSPKGYW